MSEKVVILNGKRFIVGNSKIKSTKCRIEKTKKKVLINNEKLKKTNISLCRKRKSKRITRKRREIKDKTE